MDLCDAWIPIAKCKLGLMNITEHNLQNTDLNLDDVNLLIRLVKEESKKHEGDPAQLLYCGVLIGKLVCIRHDLL